MSGTGWLWLIGGGLLAYYLIARSGATFSVNPVGNILNKPTSPAPPGQSWQWNGFQWVTVPIGAAAM